VLSNKTQVDTDGTKVGMHARTRLLTIIVLDVKNDSVNTAYSH
jgi:hypothetical protein